MTRRTIDILKNWPLYAVFFAFAAAAWLIMATALAFFAGAALCAIYGYHPPLPTDLPRRCLQAIVPIALFVGAVIGYGNAREDAARAEAQRRERRETELAAIVNDTQGAA